MSISFTKKEVLHLLLSSIILGFVFGFDDKRPVFILSLWFQNYLFVTLLSFISLLIFILSQKIISSIYRANSEYRVWYTRRFLIRESGYIKSKQPEPKLYETIPLGIILPILVILFSKGSLPFSAVLQTQISAFKPHRIGKKFSEVTEYESSVIALCPIITCMIIALLSKFLNLESLYIINLSLAISNILPLPKLNGMTIFFGSRFLYIFSFFLITLLAIFSYFLPIFASIVFSLLASIIILILYYFFREIKS